MNTTTSYPTISSLKKGYHVWIPQTFAFVRVVRTDGLFIHEFPLSDLYHNREFFDKWCDKELFNIERVEERDNGLIYFVT